MSTVQPQVGETWWRPSFPLPTVVLIVGRHGDGTVTLKYRRQTVSRTLDWFAAQGFKRKESEPQP